MQTKTRILTSIVVGVALLAGVAGVSPSLSQAQAANAPQKVDVLIGFTNTPGSSEQALVRGHGGVIKHSYHLVPAIAASVPESAIQGLLNNPRITSIEPNGTVYAIDAELDNTWGVKRIGAGTVHDSGNKGAGVKVAVIDSGIDYNHLDLGANFAGGYNFVSGSTNPMDDNGHGTHIAGTIAALDNNVGVVGVAPEARLYALKVLNSSGSGSWSDVIAALQWAVDNGIQVTNNSYGSGQNPGGIVQAAFDNSAARGILHIAAAGNSGNPKGKGNNVGYPAAYASVVAVGATDKNDTRASFSSTGDPVELVAPGVTINSTKLGGGYIEYSGTSMASPHVAGSAALVIAAGITDKNGNGLINDEVRQALDGTAFDLGAAGRDSLYGFGLVNVAAAVASVVPVTPPPPSAAGIISGTVIDAAALTPIAGAAVTDGTRSATTDINGAYALINVPEGTYTVSASAVGYQNASQSVAVVGNTTSTANFSLQAVSQATSVAVNSVGYATEGGKNHDRHLLITVALADNLGGAVSGASVSIDLSRDGSFVGSGTGTTGLTGTVTLTLKNASSGCYVTNVTNVSAAGLTWNSLTPANGICK
jgi:subtilisin